MLNAAVRHINESQIPRLNYSSNFDTEKSGILRITDRVFDNMPKHRLQRGHFLLLSDGRIVSGHSSRYGIHCVPWQSSRMRRVARSTLSAETYDCNDTMGTLDWTTSMYQYSGTMTPVLPLITTELCET